jgi:hypothetical protein
MSKLPLRSTGHSGLSLVSCGKYAFTEIQAFPLSDAPVELNGELA